MCGEMFIRGCIASRSAILSNPLYTAVVCSISKASAIARRSSQITSMFSIVIVGTL